MSGKRTVKFEIYRYDPDTGEAPRMEKLEVELEPTDKMLLDALMRIKSDVDDSLSYRRSCREGVCGSDAMNINGKNGLACITNLRDLKEPIVLKPLPGLPVVRDLIVDMTQFFKQYNSIKPYLINENPPPEKEKPNPNPCQKVLAWLTNTSTPWARHFFATARHPTPICSPIGGLKFLA